MSSSYCDISNLLKSPDYEMQTVLVENANAEIQWEKFKTTTPQKRQLNKDATPHDLNPKRRKSEQTIKPIKPIDWSWLDDVPEVPCKHNYENEMDGISYLFSTDSEDERTLNNHETTRNCTENQTLNNRGKIDFNENHPYSSLAKKNRLSFWPVRSLRDVSRKFIKELMSHTSTKQEACEVLGCSKSSLSKKLKTKLADKTPSIKL